MDVLSTGGVVGVLERDEDAEFDDILSMDLDLNSLSFLRRFIEFSVGLVFGAVRLFVRISSLPLRR